MSRKPLFRWLFYLGLILFPLGIFVFLARGVWLGESFAWDAPIILAIHQFANPLLTGCMMFITHTGQTGAVLVTFIVAGWFLKKHQRVNALAIVASLAGAVAINEQLKLFFARVRPALFPPLVIETSLSFPSGHTTMAVAVYGFLAVLLWRSGHRFWAIFSGVWVVLIAISRVYLGAHYPSDVLGAMASTSLWLLVVFTIRDRAIKQATI